jgi:hypothetical protein
MRWPIPACRAIVEKHTKLGYAPAAILNAVRETDDGFLFKYLRRTDVNNWRQRTFLSLRMKRRPLGDLSDDMNCALQWLHENTYLVQVIASEVSDLGFAFASKKHIEFLHQHGTLVLLDATHCLNAHGWKFFTVYIRTNCGIIICHNISLFHFIF